MFSFPFQGLCGRARDLLGTGSLHQLGQIFGAKHFWGTHLVMRHCCVRLPFLFQLWLPFQFLSSLCKGLGSFCTTCLAFWQAVLFGFCSSHSDVLQTSLFCVPACHIICLLLERWAWAISGSSVIWSCLWWWHTLRTLWCEPSAGEHFKTHIGLSEHNSTFGPFLKATLLWNIWVASCRFPFSTIFLHFYESYFLSQQSAPLLPWSFLFILLVIQFVFISKLSTRWISQSWEDCRSYHHISALKSSMVADWIPFFVFVFVFQTGFHCVTTLSVLEQYPCRLIWSWTHRARRVSPWPILETEFLTLVFILSPMSLQESCYHPSGQKNSTTGKDNDWNELAEADFALRSPIYG